MSWVIVSHAEDSPEVSPALFARWCASPPRRLIPIDLGHANHPPDAPDAYRLLSLIERHVGKPAPEGDLERIGVVRELRMRVRPCANGEQVTTLEASCVWHQLGLYLLSSGVELYPSIHFEGRHLVAIGLGRTPVKQRLLPVTLTIEQRCGL